MYFLKFSRRPSFIKYFRVESSSQIVQTHQLLLHYYGTEIPVPWGWRRSWCVWTLWRGCQPQKIVLNSRFEHVRRNSFILIYIQQDATLHSLFYLETALHVSAGNTTHHQERRQLYQQRLVLVRPLLLPAAIAAGSSNGVKNTRCCRYSCLRSWWWVVLPAETCRAVSR